jgi:hypothetical protein
MRQGVLLALTCAVSGSRIRSWTEQSLNLLTVVVHCVLSLICFGQGNPLSLFMNVCTINHQCRASPRMVFKNCYPHDLTTHGRKAAQAELMIHSNLFLAPTNTAGDKA